MKWTPVGSQGLDVVLKRMTRDRVSQALEKLHESSHGSKQASLRQADHRKDGARRRSQALKASLFPAVDEIGSCFCPFGGSAKWL